MPNTAVGLFENVRSADEIVRALENSGIPARDIRVLNDPSQILRELQSMGASERESSLYTSRVGGGCAMVLASGTAAAVDQAAALMSRRGAMRVEEVTTSDGAASAPSLHTDPQHYVATPPVENSSLQTGRVRQGGEGVRVFVW